MKVTLYWLRLTVSPGKDSAFPSDAASGCWKRRSTALMRATSSFMSKGFTM